MSATDELRRMLDEAGVEWKAPASYDGSTKYDTIVDDYWFHGYDGRITVHGLTPAQAIAATVRRGTCKVDVLNTGDCAGYECSEYIMHCNACGHEFGHVLYDEDGGVWMSERPRFCPNCGRRIEVDE